MDYEVFIESGRDNWGECYYQELYDNDTGEELYSVQDLSDCPEDAIIGRCLFDAYDYIRALERGIRIAKMGYDKVVVVNDGCTE